MADSNYLIEIILDAVDKASPKIAALKGQIDSLKESQKSENALEDLGNSIENAGNDAEKSERQLKKHREEQERSGKTAQNLSRDIKSSSKNIDDHSQAASGASDAHSDLTDSISKTTKAHRDLHGSQNDVTSALNETKSGATDTGSALNDLTRKYESFDKVLRSGDLSVGDAKRGLERFRGEFRAAAKDADIGGESFKRAGKSLDDIASKIKNVQHTSADGIFSNLRKNDINGFFEALDNKIDLAGPRVSGVASALQGLKDLIKIAFAQPLITGLSSIVGGLFSVGAAAAQAGAALGGAFISGIAQVVPMVSIAAAAMLRFKSILQAVSVSGEAEKQSYFEPHAGEIKHLQNQSQLVSSQQQLTNSSIQLFDAQQRVRSSQIALTEARVDAIRNITDLELAERSAKLAAEGSTISLVEARRSLQIAIAHGDTAGISSSELQIKQAELAKRKAQIEVPRSEYNARVARERGVSGAPSVISATQGAVAAKQAVVQAKQAAEAARRQMEIVEKELSQPASRETSTQAQLTYLYGQMSAPEKVLTKVLTNMDKELKSPNSPLKKITNYFITPFTEVAQRLQGLLHNSSFMKPIDELAKAMGTSLKQYGNFVFGGQGTSFFKVMAKDAKENLPIVTKAIIGIMKIFQDIAKAANPAFKKLSEDWVNFWSVLDKKYEGKGLEKLTDFFTKSVGYAESFAHLGKALVGLFMALGHDAAPQGLNTVTSLSGAIEKATNWVRSHGPEVTKFFREAREGLSLIGGVLFTLGKSLLEVFSVASLKAFSTFINSIVLPVLRDMINFLGKVVTILTEIINTTGPLRPFAELFVGFAATVLGIAKVYGPIMTVVAAMKALYAATKALIIGETIGKIWEAASISFGKSGKSAQEAAKGVGALDAAQAGGAVSSTGKLAGTIGGTSAVTGAAVESATGSEAVAGGIAAVTPVAALSAAAPAIAVIAGSVALLGSAYVALKSNFLNVRKPFEDFAGWVKSVFVQTWKNLSETIDSFAGSGTAKSAINVIGSALGEVWKVIKGISPDIVKFIGVGVLGGLALLVTAIASPIIIFIGTLWAMNKAFEAVKSGVELFGRIWESVWGGIKTIFAGIVGFVSERLANLITAIKTVVEIANVSLPGVGHIFGSTLTGVEHSLSSAENKLNGFAKEITSHTEHVHNEVPKIADTYATTFGKVESVSIGASRVVRDSIKEISQNTLNALRDLNSGHLQPLSKGGPPLSPRLEKTLEGEGHATGGYIPATPGGVHTKVAEGGHDEVVLTTDPRHASRQRQLLGEYLRRAPHMATGGEVEGYSYPLHGTVNQGRTDQGVDYDLTPGSPITSIGRSVVKGIIPNWYQNQPYIWAELLGGPDKGKNFYVAEQITKLAKVGQQLKAGQPLAYYAPSGTGIEIGWATSSGQTLATSTSGYTEGQLTPAGASFKSFLSGLQHGKIIGESGGGVGGTFSKIVSPIIKGGGAIGAVAQNALNLVTAGANKYLEKHAQSSGSVSGNLAPGSPLTGTVPKMIMSYFRGKGLSKAGAAGIAGNIEQESSFDPNAPGGGLIQGQGGRTSSGTTQQQLEGIWRELITSYSGTLSGLKKAKSPAEAARVFSEQFERPGIPMIANRERYANEVASQYVAGGSIGRAPWGGGPVPIIAHEGERIMNPNQYHEVSRPWGGAHALDSHLGFNSSPRQHFADGGIPRLGKIHLQKSSGSNPALSLPNVASLANLTDEELNSISLISKVLQQIEKGFKKLSKSKKNAEYLKIFEEFTSNILIAETGLLSRLEEGREIFKQKAEQLATKAGFKSGKGGLVSSLSPVAVQERTFKSLVSESKYIGSEQKIAGSTADKIKSEIKSTRHEKPSAQRTTKLNNLVAKYNEAAKKQRELAALMDQNIEARYQAESQKIQAGLSLIESAYQLSSQEKQAKLSSAQERGQYNLIPSISKEIVSSAQSQISSLQAKLSEAKGIGDNELVNQIAGQIASLQQTISQAVIEQLTATQSLIQQKFQASEAELGSQKSIAQALGNLSEIPGLDQIIKKSAEEKYNELGNLLTAAEAQGDVGLATTIIQERAALKTTIETTVVEEISAISALIKREAGEAQSKSSLKQSLSKVAASEGKYEEAGSLEKEGLEITQRSLISQRNKDEGLLGDAYKAGDTEAVITLTEELNKNTAEIAENNLALKENAVVSRELLISQIEQKGQFGKGIYSSLTQGLEIMGKITGATNVKALLGAAEGEKGILGNERGELEGQAAGVGLGAVQGMNAQELLSWFASSAGQSTIKNLESTMDVKEKEQMYKLVQSLEGNSIATDQNTQKIAELNGHLNQPQSWSTTAWQQFRGAFFNGMGNILPSTASMLPPGTAPINMPVYGSANPGTNIGKISLTHPVEKLDPQMFGEELSFHINTAPTGAMP